MEILFYGIVAIMAFFAIPLLIYQCAKMATLGYLKARQYMNNMHNMKSNKEQE
jgi:hypothetical protein